MAGRRIVTQWQIFVAHARLVDEMRAFGDGVERTGLELIDPGATSQV